MLRHRSLPDGSISMWGAAVLLPFFLLGGCDTQGGMEQQQDAPTAGKGTSTSTSASSGWATVETPTEKTLHDVVQAGSEIYAVGGGGLF